MTVDPPSPPSHPRLPLPGTVHVWHGVWSDSATDGAIGFLEAQLNATEKSRADRFRFPHDRRHFICARAMLRLILGSYLRLPGSALQLIALEHGKPALAPGDNQPGLEFNLSHAGHRAALAVTVLAPVGIDIERVDRTPDWSNLASTVFSEREQIELASVPADRQRLAFFHGWTRKEAFLKATGIGLVNDLSALEVTLDPEQPARIITALNGTPHSGNWFLHSFTPEEGFVGALAQPAPSAIVTHLTFNPDNHRGADRDGFTLN